MHLAKELQISNFVQYVTNFEALLHNYINREFEMFMQETTFYNCDISSSRSELDIHVYGMTR